MIVKVYPTTPDHKKIGLMDFTMFCYAIEAIEQGQYVPGVVLDRRNSGPVLVCDACKMYDDMYSSKFLADGTLTVKLNVVFDELLEMNTYDIAGFDFKEVRYVSN